MIINMDEGLLFKRVHLQNIVESAQKDAIHPDKKKVTMVALDRGQGQDRDSYK